MIDGAPGLKQCVRQSRCAFMQPLKPEETKRMRGAVLRRDPAREPCFNVVQDPNDLADYADMSPTSRRQRLHRSVHNEMQNLEIAAQTLVDFPDASWDVRLQIARQCWDEVRHTQLFYRRLQALGGRKGEFPVMNYEWGVVCMLDSLPARLAVQNRTFEAGELDLFRHLMGVWRNAGDDETAEMLDGILADEVQHVRFANQWLKRAAREEPRALMGVARGVAYLRAVTEALAAKAGDTNAAGVDLTQWTHLDVYTSVEDRRLAEFTPEEISRVLRQEGFGHLAEAASNDARR
jgi:uncharacterized ferritin-like protein (DUF455 family)